MAASLTDLFRKLGGASSLVNTARVTSTRAAAGATLAVDNCNWDQTTAKYFATYQVNTSGAVVAGTEIIWNGIVTGTTSIGSLTRIAGASDTGNAIGDYVQLLPSSAWANALIQGILVQHNQDGTHAAVTATSVSATGVINASAVSSLQDASVAMSTYRTDYAFDFVQSGLVWSGLGYGSTLTAAMTSGVVYINGQRLAIGAVATRTFTASKDTYIDILNTAGVGSIVYTEVANNAASPALAANSLRIGIIVTGVGNIAAAGSINQGQETMVLPIASSIPYAVTDSLGNLICPRDPNRKILGYRQITSNFSTSSATAVQVTGLSVPVIVPTGRKIKLTGITPLATNTAAITSFELSLWDGTVGSGTKLNASTITLAAANYFTYGNLSVPTTPSATSKTYNLGIASTGGSNLQLSNSATTPAFIMVELV